MKGYYPLQLATLLFAVQGMAQPNFTNGTSLLGHAANSGGCMAVVDMDGDGLDDVVQLHMSKHVYVLYQEADGTFTTVDYGTISNSSQWGWAVGDLDGSGHKDIVSGGNGDGTHLLRISERGVSDLSSLPGPNIFQQNMSIADINNDGRVDIFACNDVGAPNLWLTDANGDPQINNSYIDWSTTPASDASGNYSSCFADVNNDGFLDLLIGKCRQGVNSPADPRRWNRLFINDGTHQYNDEALERGAQDREQTWSVALGDYDNDGDFDMVMVQHSTSTQLLENDGTGHFTYVTAGSGLGMASFPLQTKFADLDNDGFLDILVAGGSEFYYKGNGDGTFTAVPGVFPNGKAMHSFAIGDLNGDGFEDVYANYGNGYVEGSAGNPDILWLNTPNGNHFFRVRLYGTQSNPDAVGARVTIQGPWGTQIREVRSGESYGLVNSFTMHFGLGAETIVPTMTVRWPSGLEETFTDLHADQTITVVEDECISPNVAIVGDPGNALCSGAGPIELSVEGAGSYTWNTGVQNATITVSEPGNYYVTTGEGTCITQANMYVRTDPDETPTITASGPTVVCPQDVVELTSSAADSYLWSNGSDQRTIPVEAPGSYSVTVQGACDEFTSAAIVVSHLDAPEAPQSEDVTLNSPGEAELVATGDSLLWYSQAQGGEPIGNGSPWTTPWLASDSTFWVADLGLNQGEASFGAKTDRSTAGAYHTNAEYYPLFSTFEDMIIQSVKVYANGAANRTIALVNEVTGDQVYTSSFSIPDGESRVQLGWAVPGGGHYGLRVANGNPQLWRDGLGSFPDFPYDLGGLGSLTGTNAGSANYYYFFYDWEVSPAPVWCESPRTAVHVAVDPTTGIDDLADASLRVFPNPATDRITFRGELPAGATRVDFLDPAGRACLQAPVRAGSAVVDVSSLAKGVYTVRVQGVAGVANARFVKQ